MEFIQNLDWAAIADLVAKVIAVAATLAAITPTPKDNNLLSKAVKFLNMLGMNVGNAKNEQK